MCGAICLSVPPATQPAHAADGRAPATATQTAALAVLTVGVTDLRNKKGHVRLDVFDRAAGFPKERGAALLWKSVPADAMTARSPSNSLWAIRRGRPARREQQQ